MSYMPHGFYHVPRHRSVLSAPKAISALRHVRLNGECMHGASELFLERAHNEALPRDAALALKRLRADDHAEMTFPAVAKARVAAVTFRFVNHLKVGWRERSAQFFFDSLGDFTHI